MFVRSFVRCSFVHLVYILIKKLLSNIFFLRMINVDTNPAIHTTPSFPERHVEYKEYVRVSAIPKTGVHTLNDNDGMIPTDTLYTANFLKITIDIATFCGLCDMQNPVSMGCCGAPICNDCREDINHDDPCFNCSRLRQNPKANLYYAPMKPGANRLWLDFRGVSYAVAKNIISSDANPSTCGLRVVNPHDLDRKCYWSPRPHCHEAIYIIREDSDAD